MTEKTPDIGIFRLVTGEDVISEWEMKNGHFNFTHPLKLIFRRLATGEVGVLLIPWIPEEVIAPNIITCPILLRDILTIFEARQSMKDFYLDVRTIRAHQLKKNDQKLDQHIADMSATYMMDQSKGFHQRLMEEYEEHFNNLDIDESIVFH